MCSELIDKLENKYQTVIEKMPDFLVEKSKIYCKSILKDSKIILGWCHIFTRFETEEKIQSLNKLTMNKTTAIIAHRLSTILNSDKIYVMDKGIVSDSGSHEELLKKSDIYKSYYNKQINKS